jgi:hypothetical protein
VEYFYIFILIYIEWPASAYIRIRCVLFLELLYYWFVDDIFRIYSPAPRPSPTPPNNPLSPSTSIFNTTFALTRKWVGYSIMTFLAFIGILCCYSLWNCYSRLCETWFCIYTTLLLPSCFDPHPSFDLLLFFTNVTGCVVMYMQQSFFRFVTVV